MQNYRKCLLVYKWKDVNSSKLQFSSLSKKSHFPELNSLKRGIFQNSLKLNVTSYHAAFYTNLLLWVAVRVVQASLSLLQRSQFHLYCTFLYYLRYLYLVNFSLIFLNAYMNKIPGFCSPRWTISQNMHKISLLFMT